MLFIVLFTIALLTPNASAWLRSPLSVRIIRFPHLTHRSSSRLDATLDLTASTIKVDDEGNSIVVNPRRFKKGTKQLATLGPASNTVEMIEKLFLSGADIFRLNFSHGEHAEKEKLVNMIRQIEKKYNHPIAILGDLQGPKLRVGTFEEDFVTLIEGQSFTFDLQDELVRDN